MSKTNPKVIVGTGIDIVDVSRIEEKLGRSGFKEKVFSPSEIEYCEKASNPFPHFAARFAAKEAFLKATGLGLNLTFDLSHIQVKHDRSGQPTLSLSGDIVRLATESRWDKFFLSLSHIDTVACAIVTIERLP